MLAHFDLRAFTLVDSNQGFVDRELPDLDQIDRICSLLTSIDSSNFSVSDFAGFDGNKNHPTKILIKVLVSFCAECLQPGLDLSSKD